MTDIDLDELIAEARSLSTYEGSTLERAADALEQVRRSADECWKQYDAVCQEKERLQRTLADADRQFTALKVSSGKTDAAAIDLRAERDEALAVIERAKVAAAWPRDSNDVVRRELETIPADALREHDAALIESLAEKIRHKQHAESIRQMLMGEARERREGVS